jgi:hypothetical protein
MPLQKILFKPGVNRENTRYTTEGGWYECDKVRFRQGNPEMIGGWVRYSANTFLGVCRSLWNWVTTGGFNLIGVGTNLKFYIVRGGEFNDITPLRSQVTINNNPFSTTNGSAVVTVTDTLHGGVTGDFVTFSGMTISSVVIAGTAGQFSCTATTLSVGMAIQISGTNAGSGSIVGYTSPTNYYIIATNGTTTFTLSATLGGSAITTTAGIPFGLTYAKTVGGLDLNKEFQMTVLTVNTYTITASTAATSTVTGGGAAVVAAYQVEIGSDIQQPVVGWGAGAWGEGPWGAGVSSSGAVGSLRIWSQNNFGDSLVFGPRGGGMYYWDSSLGVTTRAVLVSSLPGADSWVPTIQNYVFVSDTSRFVFAFGTNDPANIAAPNAQDPMLVRWSDQEQLTVWQPAATNQAGSVRLSHGSEIVTAIQTRQEIIVFTDSSVYSMQYLGPPFVWATQLLGDNISIYSQNCAVLASGVVYWMGVDKFYMYDGRVQTLNCDLRRFVFGDINKTQNQQIFGGTNEGFNEIWWFYCSENSTETDRYVIYNYIEKVWYYGTMSRTAWLDSGLLDYPVAATYNSNAGTGLLINQEFGLNDVATATVLPINAYISSSEFDIGDGHNFAFVWRVIPDLTFGDSTLSDAGAEPVVTMTLQGLTNSGSGVTSSASQSVVQTSTYALTEEFTGQIYTRFRGRQMIFKIESNQVNTTWQLGAPRIDIRQDGRR